jgi:exodeoxyribonuclease III
MAFRKKADIILEHKPDILIIPECEHPDKLKFNEGTAKPTDMLWFGTNKNKGLGIFSYSDFRFKQLDIYNPAIKMVIPIAVSGEKFDFTLFAIWANNPTDKDGPYVEQIWKALHQYEYQLSNRRTILIGDFNSNTIWDRKRRVSNHSNVVKVLHQKGIVSSYHLHHKQTQGKEEHPTLYMYRHKNKPYHIDYCFTSVDMAKKIQSVEIGLYDDWIKYSDHVPVAVTFNLKRALKRKNQ